MASAAGDAIRRCLLLAAFSEEPEYTTRRFLSAPMRDVHNHLRAWMTDAGMTVRVDAAGNLRGVYPASSAGAQRLLIGSHLDTVPRAGAFDGVLGVMLGVALVEGVNGRRLPFAIEIIGFSDEEGVRFGVPFIGSRALAGSVDEALLQRRDREGRSVRDAIREYGLEPRGIDDAAADPSAIAYLEFHIEQGPVLERLGAPVGIVDGIVGQTRAEVIFTGTAGHAGTTPMSERRDALAGAVEWIGTVEREAQAIPGLVATVGRIDAEPGAANVIPGRCRATIDVRHADDSVRGAVTARMAAAARDIASRRRLDVAWSPHLDQRSVAFDGTLVAALERAVRRAEAPVHHLSSGAGHDAMIMAARMPAAMLFLRTPGGLSHHPDESVAEADVSVALEVARRFLDELAVHGGGAVQAAHS
jgi:allantoate deiminase